MKLLTAICLALFLQLLSGQSQAIIAPRTQFIFEGQATPSCLDVSYGWTSWEFPDGTYVYKQPVAAIINNCSADIVVTQIFTKEAWREATDYAAPTKHFSYVLISTSTADDKSLSLSLKYEKTGQDCTEKRPKKYQEDNEILFCKNFSIPSKGAASIATTYDHFFRITGRMKNGEEVKIDGVLIKDEEK